ncbi:MAG: hypothetical protein EOS65_02565 [Mesorhizobium sp.]|uniref:hypothetical protein n=1 Tax=Mesorhizobium sp. TaxID=1871066 RepID=UPI000FE6971C|nr:hypothetical protein [Mesorhizobium sp.]RWF44278.1 MAG: hypothetical protein EOS65_02565 [Mesorhizobium sp.]
MPSPPNADRITGQTRYRSGWFGKLILQVEENVSFYRPVSSGNPSRMVETRWRDARRGDLYLIEWHERQKQPRVMPTTGSAGKRRSAA